MRNPGADYYQTGRALHSTPSSQAENLQPTFLHSRRLLFLSTFCPVNILYYYYYYYYYYHYYYYYYYYYYYCCYHYYYCCCCCCYYYYYYYYYYSGTRTTVDIAWAHGRTN